MSVLSGLALASPLETDVGLDVIMAFRTFFYRAGQSARGAARSSRQVRILHPFEVSAGVFFGRWEFAVVYMSMLGEGACVICKKRAVVPATDSDALRIANWRIDEEGELNGGAGNGFSTRHSAEISGSDSLFYCK